MIARHIVRSVLLAWLGGTGACATVAYQPPRYDLPLTAVERPSDVSERWGDYTLEATDSAGFVYADELIRLTAVPLRGTFALELENRSSQTIQLPWDEAAYVGPDGYSSRVVKGETRQLFDQQNQTPTVIPRGARVLVTAVPLTLVDASAFGPSYTDFVTATRPASAWEGQTIRLLLPISVEGVINEYTLTFTLRNVVFPGGTYAATASAPLERIEIPGAPYRIPDGAQYVGRRGGRVAFRLIPSCTAWFDIPEREAQFFWGAEFVRKAGYTISGADGCR